MNKPDGLAFFATTILLAGWFLCVHPSANAQKNDSRERYISYLISQLKSSDPTIRGKTAWALGVSRDAAAVPPLTALAQKDDNLRVRQQAIDALGDMESPDAVEPLITLLQDPDTRIRIRAMEALKRIRDPRVSATLVDVALRNADELLRQEAIEALQTNDDRESCVKLLVEALNDLDANVTRNGLQALAAIKDPASVEPLIALAASSKDESVRLGAAAALAAQDDPRITPFLVASLKDGSPAFRRFAAHALEKTKDPGAMNGLIAALGDEDWLVRNSSVLALGNLSIELQDNLAASAVAGALNDREWTVRLSAASVLSQVKIPSATPALLRAALRDENGRVRSTASKTLQLVDDLPFSAAVEEALGEPDPRIRQNAVEFLSSRKEPASITILIRVALRDSDADVRERATLVLGTFDDPRIVNGMIAALKDNYRSVGLHAVEALGRLRDFRALQPLIEIEEVKTADPALRASAAAALGEIGDDRSIEPLIRALRDEDKNVRKSALDSLKRITGQDFGEDHEMWVQWETARGKDAR